MPLPTPSQILEQIRSYYLARLRQGMADNAGEGIITVVSEAALRGRDGQLLRRGSPPLPVRVDLITLVNEQVRDGMEIDSETMPGFPPFSLKWRDTMPVTISPFPWSACIVRTQGVSKNLGPVIEWFEKWFDIEETATPAEDGLLGVVHSLSRSQQSAADQFTLDLGSAPVEAFEEMIEAMHASGAQALEIGTPPSAKSPKGVG